jgi:hypothetical protein
MTGQERTVRQLLAIADAAEALARKFEDLTTDEFSRGEGLVERAALREALGMDPE